VKVYYQPTDYGNAQRLAARHRPDLRYCGPFGRWYRWDGRRWREDSDGEVMRRAKATARAMQEEALTIKNQTERQQALRFALASESHARLKAMTELAKSERGIPVTPDELDADRWLLNVQNGTLNLQSGILREHQRENLITKLAPVTYDPSAACPTWDAFLSRIMDGDAALIGFLQRITGYALTGDTSENAMFLLYGTGRNGKSTYLETVRALLGDYAKRTPAETLLATRREGAREDLARLKGARFVSASETEGGRRLAESLVKDMTGGDTLAARFLYSGTFEFKPEFKLFLATNHKPTVQGTDTGIWSRIKMIPFTVRIPDAAMDKHLGQKLLAELPGILAWAVRGRLAWQRDGLGVPEAVRAATESYRAEMDVLGQFLATCCTEASGAFVPVGDLYAAYQRWCEANGERYPFSQRGLGLRLKERGLEQGKGTGGVRVWKGLGLLPNAVSGKPIVRVGA
jgi:putative DNA primase/helicase